MIAIFSPTLTDAMKNSATIVGLALAIVLAIVHLIPTNALIFMRAGKNFRYFATRIPLAGSVVDWGVSSYASLPVAVQVLFESTVLSVLKVTSATVFPSAILTWASLAALVACVSSCYWSLYTLIYKKYNLKENIGSFLFHAFAIAVLITGILKAAVAFAPTYVGILTSGMQLGPGCYLGCALAAGIISAAYVALTPLTTFEATPTVNTLGSMELSHVQTISIVATIAAMSCMLL